MPRANDKRFLVLFFKTEPLPFGDLTCSGRCDFDAKASVEFDRAGLFIRNLAREIGLAGAALALEKLRSYTNPH